MRLNQSIDRIIKIMSLVLVISGCANRGEGQPLPAVNPSSPVVDYVDTLVNFTSISIGDRFDRILEEPIKPFSGDGFRGREGGWCSRHVGLETTKQFSEKMEQVCSLKGGAMKGGYSNKSNLSGKGYCAAGTTLRGEENIIFAYEFLLSPICFGNYRREPGNMFVRIHEKTTAELSEAYLKVLTKRYGFKTKEDLARIEQQKIEQKQRSVEREQERLVQAQRKQEALVQEKMINRATMTRVTLGQKICRWGVLQYESFRSGTTKYVDGAVYGEFLRHNNDANSPRVEVRIQGWAMNKPWVGSQLADVSGYFRMDLISSEPGGVYWDDAGNWEPCVEN